MVGAAERVKDSVQPVHSWNESQITDGRLALSRAAATAGIALGGNAIKAVRVAHHFKNPRRLMPMERSESANVGSAIVIVSSELLWAHR